MLPEESLIRMQLPAVQFPALAIFDPHRTAVSSTGILEEGAEIHLISAASTQLPSLSRDKLFPKPNQLWRRRQAPSADNGIRLLESDDQVR
jgi:hypothetical protein